MLLVGAARAIARKSVFKKKGEGFNEKVFVTGNVFVFDSHSL